VRAAVPELADILLHAEPEGHADGRAAHVAPLRPEIERRLRAELAQVATVQIVAVRLDYRDDGLRIDLVLDGPVVDEASLRARLEACLNPLLPMPASVILTSPDA
jgi:hypothetical protein